MNRLVGMLGGNLSQPVDDAIAHIWIEAGTDKSLHCIKQPGRLVTGVNAPLADRAKLKADRGPGPRAQRRAALPSRRSRAHGARLAISPAAVGAGAPKIPSRAVAWRGAPCAKM